MELFGDPGGTKNESGLSYGTFLEGTRIVKDEVMRRLGTKIEDFIGRWDFSWGRRKASDNSVMGRWGTEIKSFIVAWDFSWGR